MFASWWAHCPRPGGTGPSGPGYFSPPLFVLEVDGFREDQGGGRQPLAEPGGSHSLPLRQRPAGGAGTWRGSLSAVFSIHSEKLNTVWHFFSVTLNSNLRVCALISQLGCGGMSRSSCK